MNKKIRVGIIGAGFIGRCHATAYRNINCVFGADIYPELVVVADVNEKNANSLYLSHGFKRYTTNWRDVITADDVDLVCIATPNNSHCEIAMEAAKNGKHINCEKPLGMNASEAREALTVVNSSGVCATVGFNTIKIPVIEYAKKVINSGELGYPVSFRGTYDTDGLADEHGKHEWRLLKENSSYGALGDLGAHILSISQYLLGDIESVSGMTKIVYSKRQDRNDPSKMVPVENDDISQFMYRYKNGGIGMIVSSRVGCGRKQSETFEIQFTKGNIVFTLERLNEIQIYRHTDPKQDQGFKNIIVAPGHGEYGHFFGGAGIGLGYEDLKTIEAYHLLKNIVDGAKPEIDFEFAYKINQIMDAVLKSSESGEWIAVEDLK